MFSLAMTSPFIAASVLAAAPLVRTGRDPWTDFLRIGNFSTETEIQLTAQVQALQPPDRALGDMYEEEIAAYMGEIGAESVPGLESALTIYQRYNANPELSVAEAAALQLRAMKNRAGMTLGQAITAQYRDHAQHVARETRNTNLQQLIKLVDALGEGLDDDYELIRALIKGVVRLTGFPGGTLSQQSHSLMMQAFYPESLAMGAAYCFQMVDRARFSNNVQLDREQISAEARDIASRVTIPTFIDHALNISSYPSDEAEKIEDALHIRTELQTMVAAAFNANEKAVELTSTRLQGLRMIDESAEDYLDRLTQLKLPILSHVLSLQEGMGAELASRHQRRILDLLEKGTRTQGIMVYGYPAGIRATFTPVFVVGQDEFRANWTLLWSGHHDRDGAMKLLESQGKGVILYHRETQLNDEEMECSTDFCREIIAEKYGAAFKSVQIDVMISETTGATPLRSAQYVAADTMALIQAIMSGDHSALAGLDPDTRQRLMEQLPIPETPKDDDDTAPNNVVSLGSVPVKDENGSDD